MDAVTVLVDAKGAVVGIARATDPTQGGPTATLVPREGQSIRQVRLSAAEARLDADSLIAALRKNAPSRATVSRATTTRKSATTKKG